MEGSKYGIPIQSEVIAIKDDIYVSERKYQSFSHLSRTYYLFIFFQHIFHLMLSKLV